MSFQKLSPLLGFVWLFVLWWLATALGNVNPLILPAPGSVAQSLITLAADGRLLEAVMISLGRIIAGFVLAMLVGGGLGLCSGYFRWPRLLLQPPASFLRYVPPTAFISLFILYFGIGEAYKIAVIFAGCVFFAFTMTLDAVRQIDRRYLEMRQVTGETSMGLFRHVIWPAVEPRLIDIGRVNLSGAWIFLVVAEITGANGGLGHLISQAQRFMRTDELFAGIIMFGIIGLITDFLLKSLGRWWFPWDQANRADTR